MKRERKEEGRRKGGKEGEEGRRGATYLEVC